MADEKLIALLLDALEDAYVDTTMLRTMVMTYRDHFPEIGDWEKTLEALKAEGGQAVRTRFAPLRAAASRSRDVERALEQFLKGPAPKGPVQ
jgi:hypothetical protein